MCLAGVRGHVAVQELSRQELEIAAATLMRKQEEMVAELHHLVAQSDALIEDLPADERVAAIGRSVAIGLQQALVELIHDESDTESDDGDEESDAARAPEYPECDPASVERGRARRGCSCELARCA